MGKHYNENSILMTKRQQKRPQAASRTARKKTADRAGPAASFAAKARLSKIKRKQGLDRLPGDAEDRTGGAPDGRRREAIATAALKLFSEFGFTSISNKELGAAAGVNPALIYYYFKGKEDLFQFVVRKALADAHSVYEKLRRKQSGIGALEAWLSSNLVLSAEFSRFIKVVLDYCFSKQRSSATDEAIARFYSQEIDILTGALSRETRTKGRQTAQLAQLVSVFLDGVMVARVIRPELHPKQLVNSMRALLEAK
jgi:TetR/AcrR family transcriptional regulator, upper aerobic nicotinate degradation pathway regulator